MSSDRMSDERLRRVLSSLREEETPPGFTKDVMARVRRERRFRAARSLLLAAAAVVAVAIGGYAVLRSSPDGPTLSADGAAGRGGAAAAAPGEGVARSELDALLEEYRRLAEDVEAYRGFARQPIVRIGGDERVDVFMDVRDIGRLAVPVTAPEGRVIPAGSRSRRR